MTVASILGGDIALRTIYQEITAAQQSYLAEQQ